MKQLSLYLLLIILVSCSDGSKPSKENIVITDTITKVWFYKQLQKDTLTSIKLDSKILNKLFTVGNKKLNLDTGAYILAKIRYNRTEDEYIIHKTNSFKTYYHSIFFEFRTLPNSLELIQYNYQFKTDSSRNSYESTICDYYFKNDSLLEKLYDEHSEDMYFPYKNLEEFKKHVNDNTKGIIIK